MAPRATAGRGHAGAGPGQLRVPGGLVPEAEGARGPATAAASDDGRREVLAEAIDAMADLTRDLAATGTYPFRERSLGRAQMNVLYQLSRADGLGIRALAELLDVTSGAVSQHLDALRSAGLVDVAVDPRDARARLVTLTDTARQEVDEFQRGWIDAIAPRFDALTTDDVRALRGLLSRVRPRVEEGR